MVNLERARAVAQESEDGGLIMELVREVEQLREGAN